MPERPPPSPPAVRAFWTYWAATATSSAGSAVTTVALPLTAVLILHAGSGQMGVLAAAGYLAWLVIGLPAGALVGRLRLRAVQVGLDVVRAVALATIPVAWWLHTLHFWHLVVVALVISFADVLFDVANSTFLPRVVPKDQLQERNSLMSGTFAVSQLGGPSLGGVLVQTVGAVGALLADTVSYLASAVLLRSLPDIDPVAADESRARMRTMIADGWRFVNRHRVIGPCMWDATAINFVCGGQMALFALYLVHTTSAPAGLVGFLLAAEGVGSLIGAALAPSVARRVGTARICLYGGLISVLGTVLIPLGSGMSAWVAFALGNIVFAGGVVWTSITTRTYRQTETPPELLARVMATVRFVSWGAIPVGSLSAGALAALIGVRPTLWVLAGCCALSPLIFWRALGRARDLPATADATV